MLTERGLDWVLNGVGAIALIVGGIVVLWALFADRARGRKRCPKCWYDLTVSPGMRCSECGFVARTERRLRKTRRHWRRGLFGLSVIVVGRCSLAYPNWRTLAPTTTLIYLMPDLETDHAELYKSLESRMTDDRLADWQWEWLLDRCLDENNLPAGVYIETRERWPEGVDIHYAIRPYARRTGIRWLDQSDKYFELSIADALSSSQARQMLDSVQRIRKPSSSFEHYTVPADFAGAGSLEVTVGVVVTHTRVNSSTEVSPTMTRSLPLVFPVDVRGAVDDVIRPIDSTVIQAALREGARVRIASHGMYFFMPAEAVDEFDDVAFGLIIELRRDDMVVSTGHLLLDAGEWPGGSIRVDMERISTLVEIQNSDATWMVRIRGDGELALLDFDATKYWDGDFTLPMYFEDSSRLSPIWADQSMHPDY